MRINLKTQIWLTIASIILLFTFFMLLFFPAQHQKSLVKYYNQEVQNLANTVALGVEIALTEQNFEGVQTAIDFAKADKRLRFVSLMQIDTVWAEDSSSRKVEKIVLNTYPEDYEVSVDITSSDSLIVRSSPFYTEMIVGEVVIGFTTSEIKQSITQIKKTSILASLVVFLVGLAVGYFLARKISIPVLALRNAAIKVGAGDLSQRVDMKLNDEIGELGGAFNVMVENLAEAENKIQQKNKTLQKQNEIINQKNKDITDSITYAQKIQEAILPTDEHLKSLFPESFVLFKPKDIVSGDFYWASEKNGKYLIAVADCTGHGVPGAFMSMIGNSLLNEIVNEKGILCPGEILQALKEGVIKSLKQTGGAGQQKDGMDIGFLTVDYNNNKIEYAGAYNPLYQIRDGELLETKADRMPIGIYEDDEGKVFTNCAIELKKGDSFYIFTDGLQDQFGGPKDKKFRAKRFKQVLLDMQHMSMEEQKIHLAKQ